MMNIALSIHATDSFKLENIQNLKGLDFIHVDVMDGKFVKNVCLNLNLFELIKDQFDLPIIAHMMVIDPANYLKKVIENIHGFFFHYESEGDKFQIIREVHDHKRKVGIVLNPETSINKITEFLPLIDYVLILGVHPGYSGQKFIPNTVSKVQELSKFKVKFPFLIDVDGGVNLENAIYLRDADILSSASTILHARNPNEIINKLKLL